MAQHEVKGQATVLGVEHAVLLATKDVVARTVNLSAGGGDVAGCHQ
jgi:hypothetical protein